ncbi:hypothetical protein [Streptomyces sp. NPDC093149]
MTTHDHLMTTHDHLMTTHDYRAEIRHRFAIWDEITGAVGWPITA